MKRFGLVTFALAAALTWTGCGEEQQEIKKPPEKPKLEAEIEKPPEKPKVDAEKVGKALLDSLKKGAAEGLKPDDSPAPPEEP